MSGIGMTILLLFASVNPPAVLATWNNSGNGRLQPKAAAIAFLGAVALLLARLVGGIGRTGNSECRRGVHLLRHESEVARDDGGRVEVHHLVDGGHDPVLHQLLDHVDGGDTEHVGEVLDRDRVGEADRGSCLRHLLAPSAGLTGAAGAPARFSSAEAAIVPAGARSARASSMGFVTTRRQQAGSSQR